ncbi:mitochondrial ribosomal death-associated protein 3-domain-containing protein [Podospora conica]|nr:mitochondrial ribosomal death-associated protein 3-domain-containing protein [Schizothecium conicum]
MSAALMLRSLVRPSAVPRAAWTWTATQTSSFSKTASPSGGLNPTRDPLLVAARLARAAERKQKAAQRGRRGGEAQKKAAPGDAKALRKRIQLSNSNALPVPGLEDVQKGDLVRPENIGLVLSIPGQVQDQLRTVEAFKPTQFWHLFRHASTLVRAETVDMAQRLEEAAVKKQTLRLIYDGPRISGKSLMLLQSMTYAFLNDWIVINVPEALELTTGMTEYAPIPNTEPTQYMQNNYCLDLLRAIKASNEKLLARLTTAHSHPELPQNIPVNSTLLQLINAAKEPEGAWLVFNALWKELMQPRGQLRPPVLFCLDGLNHVMRVSDYRSASFELIHSHDLALVRLFVDALRGAASFPGGGAVVSATSRNNVPANPSMELALQRRLALQRPGAPAPERDLYFRDYDERVLKAIPEAGPATVHVRQLAGLTKAEARSLLWYYDQSGLLKQKLDEATVAEKWTLGGHGIVGEMEKASLFTMSL